MGRRRKNKKVMNIVTRMVYMKVGKEIRGIGKRRIGIYVHSPSKAVLLKDGRALEKIKGKWVYVAR